MKHFDQKWTHLKKKSLRKKHTNLQTVCLLIGHVALVLQRGGTPSQTGRKKKLGGGEKDKSCEHTRLLRYYNRSASTHLINNDMLLKHYNCPGSLFEFILSRKYNQMCILHNAESWFSIGFNL